MLYVKLYSDGFFRNESRDSEESRTVVATARGVFDSNGGVLESKETGKKATIPPINATCATIPLDLAL